MGWVIDITTEVREICLYDYDTFVDEEKSEDENEGCE
jgi:hypothetical protein